MEILLLNTETTVSVELGQILANSLQGEDTIIVESFPSTKTTQVMMVEFLTQYDIIIFDGTIEDDAELNNSKYDFLDPSILLRDNFFVVTRNTLPMNIVPLHSNLNQYDALRNNTYQIDKNRLDNSTIDGTISNENVVDWILKEIKNHIVTQISCEDYQRQEVTTDIGEWIQSDNIQYLHPPKKHIFISYRGRYQHEKYYGYNVYDVINWIKEVYHKNDGTEWNTPFFYESASLTSEFMPEQRVWTAQNIVSNKIQKCDEFWIFETLRERDVSGNITHYSYWDSWWCLAEVMEILQMNSQNRLKEGFNFMIFNPSNKQIYESLNIGSLPQLTSYDTREFRRLKLAGNLDPLMMNLHMRGDKRGFRDASWIMKKLRYKVLEIQWNQIGQMCGEDISIPFDQYVEDVNCRVYDDAFLTQRIYMDSESMEIGRTRNDVLKEGYCKHFLNLVGTYKDTPQYEGIYMTTTAELENSLKHNLPIVVKRKEGGKMLQKELKVEEYGKMFFFWIPLRNPLSPSGVKRTGPGGCTIQEITLYRIKQ